MALALPAVLIVLGVSTRSLCNLAVGEGLYLARPQAPFLCLVVPKSGRALSPSYNLSHILVTLN